MFRKNCIHDIFSLIYMYVMYVLLKCRTKYHTHYFVNPPPLKKIKLLIRRTLTSNKKLDQ